jgi:hypothetical protein
MHLQSRAGGEVGGVAASDLGRGNVAGRVGGGRGVQERPREVERYEHLCEPVLDCLELADRTSKLDTRFGVGDRHFQQCPPEAGQLRGASQRPRVEGRLGQRAGGWEEAAGAVDGDRQLARRSAQDKVGDVGVEEGGRDCGDHLAGGESRQPLWLCEKRGNSDRFDQRAGNRMVAKLFERDHQIHRARTETLVHLGNGKSRNPELGEPTPERQPRRVLAAAPSASH